MAFDLITELRRYENSLRGSIPRTIDYSFKSYVLSQDIHKSVNHYELCKFRNNISSVTGEFYMNFIDNNTISILTDVLFQKYGTFCYLEGYRINNARYHRISRLQERISSIICKSSFFLTLTFTNDSLNSTNSLTRRRYVTRYLKSISNNYVANIDFGSRNGREHYHACVQCDRIDSKLWKYGSLNFEQINKCDDSTICLSKYISKLTNHAIKNTTKRNSMIYPKNRY